MTALVTGGGTGIGRAISEALAGLGHPVAVVYSRSADDAQRTVEAITSAGGRAEAFRADVTDEASVRAAAAAVRESLGSVTVLVNNAGGTEHIPLADLDAATDEVFERLFRLNALSAWHVAKVCADDLRAADDGCVVNVGSASVASGRGSSVPYVVSKAALSGLTRALANALAPVRVNEVWPGLVITRWWAGKEEQGRALASNAIVGRETTVEDVAAAVVGLVTSRAITGQTITIDGGQTL
ncbi:SDR family NAD(P)-dependent oxidoreductase [Actinomycetospora termitidis]|uniref:SDR family oxidoreductase n=1 Tax=Actinomycetospora termitidis TaxID=3053470 RepID=A0ABT7MC82_9PSEU|nr:SDR family oxidoreductase [Actinomycetospora sp. Odt1-22]MDL5158280.1 SDR family oxidoreductase [Actinomycetospora sp. Odt1-22]